MDMTAMLPGSRSPATRARRRARLAAEAVRHPRAARRGLGGVLVAKAGKRAALHPRAVARSARALPLAAMAQGAWAAAVTPERRSHSKRRIVGAVGVAGAGAAAAYALSKRSERNGGPQVHTTPQEGHPAGTGTRSERDIGGPTAPSAPNQGATGGAPGTPPGSGFEPHS